MRRQRVFIWCLHRSFCSQGDMAAVEEHAEDIVQRRLAMPSTQLGSLLIRRQDPAWFGKVGCDVHGRGQSRETHRASSKAAWQKEVTEVRNRLSEAGRTWSRAQPLRCARLHGLQGTERQRQTLTSALLARCHFLAEPGMIGLPPDGDGSIPAELLRAAKEQWTWDVSQNFRVSSFGAARAGHALSLCTNALVYSFAEDRILHPDELLAIFGWHGHVVTRGMSWQDRVDLAGECQALAPLAVATFALVAGVGGRLEWTAA
jgi:hypothetical protein